MSYQRLSGEDNIDEEAILYYHSSSSNHAIPEANVEGSIANDNVTRSFVDDRIYVKGNDSHSYLLASQLAEESGLRAPVVEGQKDYSYGIMIFGCLVFSLCTVFVIIYFAFYYNS
jgi:hypothetical protein